MGLFGQIRNFFAYDDSGGRSPGDDFWYAPVGSSQNAAGVQVTPDSALTLSAVFACVKVLSETVSSLPLKIYKNLPDGGKEEVKKHPLYRILHDSPNAWQTAMEFRELMMAAVVLRGNAYAEIQYSRSGDVAALIPLAVDAMEVLQLPDYRLRYSYRRPDGSLRIYTQDEIFHMRGLSSNGIVGLSPLSAAREVIGAAIATQAYGSRLFSNDARPGGILEHPGKIGEDAAVRLRQSWTAAHSGVGNSHKVAVLEEGMTFKALSMSAEDSQFLQTREFQVGEIARIFRIPPHMIGDLKRATFSNIEQQAIEFTTHTIRPWLVRWEQAIARDLIPDGEVFAEHNVDALLRGDLSGRYAAYAVGIQNGWLSSNEIRSLENLNPIEGGDEYHSVQIPLAPPPEPSTKPIVAPAEPPED